MVEPESPRMQRLAIEGHSLFSAVDRVADERVLDRREVNAYLVRASGLQPAAEERALLEALAHLVMRNGSLAARDDRHRGALDRVPTDRGVDVSAAAHHTMHERKVFAPHGSRLQLSHEIALCGLAL